MENKTWYDIAITYWSQIAVILGVIGFCITKIVDLISKKNEIRFSKLHENKILEIKSYYKSYQTLRNSLKRFYDQTLFGSHAKEILENLSQDISERFIDFEYNSMTIKLFIDTKDLATIDEIAKTMSTVRTELLIWHINARPGNSTNHPDNIERIGVILDKTLNDLVKDIENNLRKNFNSK